MSRQVVTPVKGLYRPDGAIIQPKQDPMGIFCRLCPWTVEVTVPGEIAIRSQQHLMQSHPEEFEHLEELILSAQVAQDEIGQFLDASYAVVPPAGQARQFSETMNQMQQAAAQRKSALLDIIERRLQQDATKLKEGEGQP